jgi:apolipoprotein N-acyltransferase
MTSIRILLYSILSGLLLAFSWPEIGLEPLIFIAWIPLLFVEDYMLHAKLKYGALKFYGFAYLAFLIWNVTSTFWVKNASFEGALMAFLANSALMAGVFSLVHALRKRMPSARSWIFLPILWLAFEHVHHNWELSWPWLTLGNSLAGMHPLAQWYEYTGTLGGSLWILLVNCLIYQAIRNRMVNPTLPLLSSLRFPLLVLIIPSVISLIQYFTYTEKSDSVAHVALIQPNIDPYMKFNNSSLDDQMNTFLQLSESVIDSTTDWLIGPETALVGSMDEKHVLEYPRMQKLTDFLGAYPKLNLLIGAETHQFYLPGQEKTVTARRTNDPEVFYDSYNTALLLKDGQAEFYHKSKLVPGVEQMPFPWLFKHIESFAIDLGGTTGTLARQDERTVFIGKNTNQKVAPSICYESIYGDFMQYYIRGGANFIAIITNDGWWGDTPGYKQHVAYARLRAIESRRDVVRSANTGISAVINQRGDIIDSRPYWVPAAIKADVHLNNQLTIFSLTGDVLGLSALISSLWLVIYTFVFLPFKNRKRKKSATT